MRQKKQSPKAFTSAFTLVELLVVIGIIALLISILLPALSKARDQANLVVCQSTQRQFYNIWQLYANDYKGYAVPCRMAETGASFEFWDPVIIGQEVGKATGNSDTSTGGGGNGTVRASNGGAIIQFLFKCPAADHTNDPTAQAAGHAAKAVYFGDYIYNTWMGYIDFKPPVTTHNPYLKVTQIPGNVIILMEARKPNVIQSGTTWVPITGLPGNDYKDYFQKNTELWVKDWTPSATRPDKVSLPELRIGTPHTKGARMNVLSADGHVSTVDPYRDFFSFDGGQYKVRDYLWDAKDSYPTVTGHPNWRKGAPGV